MSRILNADRMGPETEEFQQKMKRYVIDQDRAINAIARIYQSYREGLYIPDKPIGRLLFLGPTGSGKSETARAAARVIYGTEQALLTIDCAEYQQDHEVSKLIGSPPGYVGHNETRPILTQNALNQFHNEKNDISFVLFDEIEKASPTLHRMLLGILDKGRHQNGNGSKVNWTRTFIIMTSNLGAKYIDDLLKGGRGFVSSKNDDHLIYKTALNEARRYFSPEFLNRLNKIIVFRPLNQAAIAKILNKELLKLQHQIIISGKTKFIFRCTSQAKEFLLREGYSRQYGARELQRTIERFLTNKFGNLTASKEVIEGDVVIVDFDSNHNKLIFILDSQGAIIPGVKPPMPPESKDKVIVVKKMPPEPPKAQK